VGFGMTYKQRIEELKKAETKNCYCSSCNMIIGKINLLNELRAEAIAKVKELFEQQIDIEKRVKGHFSEEERAFFENQMKLYNEKQGVIDYLKTEWSIEEKDLL
jgi:hypothetical protein